MDTDTLLTLVRAEIAKQEIARQEADDTALRKLHNALSAASSAVKDLMGGEVQNKRDGIISVSVSCPACGKAVRVIRTMTDAGQRITGACAQCGQRIVYK